MDFFTNQKSRVIKKVGEYALGRFGKSDFARENLNTVLMSIATVFIKGFFSFFILSRLQTGYLVIDFFVSMVTTVFFALISPFIFLLIKEREKEFDRITNEIIDRSLRPNGLMFLVQLRNTIVLSTSVFIIIMCLLVEINSRYIIHTVVEYLVGFWLVDQVNQYKESLFKPLGANWKIETVPVAVANQLTVYSYVQIGSVKPKQKRAKLLYTDKPKSANVVNFNKPQTPPNQKKRENKIKLAGTNVVIMEDWGSEQKK